MMESEADSLRSRASLAGEGLNPAFNFGALGTANGRKKDKKRLNLDSIEELSQGDTPQIERNKLMREGKLPSQLASGSGSGSGSRSRSRSVEADALGKPKSKGKDGKGHTRRKSSISNRGKRVSSLFQEGVICEHSLILSISEEHAFCILFLNVLIDERITETYLLSTAQPHTSVSDSSFYKHIDCDLSESLRAQQLLVWCSSRVLASSSSSSAPSKKPSSKNPGKVSSNGSSPPTLPPLDDVLAGAVRAAQEDVIRMLASKKIDTSVISKLPSTSNGNASSSFDSEGSSVLAGLEGQKGEKKTADVKMVAENEQNVRNRAREVKFRGDIER